MCIFYRFIVNNFIKWKVGRRMNIGVICAQNIFDIGRFIKMTYEKKYATEKIKFVTAEEDEKIDILVIDHCIEEIFLQKYLNKLKKKSIIIVNVDDRELVRQMFGVKNMIVSYGFSNKASITLSSLVQGDKDIFMFCLQRNIQTIRLKKIIEQEFLINSVNISSMDTLIIVSVLLILDINIEEINDAFLDFFNI